jgi:hypothetical protein
MCAIHGPVIIQPRPEVWIANDVNRCLLARPDNRYKYSLGGGALMDSGCYAVDMASRARRFDPGSRFGASETARS